MRYRISAECDRDERAQLHMTYCTDDACEGCVPSGWSVIDGRLYTGDRDHNKLSERTLPVERNLHAERMARFDRADR